MFKIASSLISASSSLSVCILLDSSTEDQKEMDKTSKSHRHQYIMKEKQFKWILLSSMFLLFVTAILKRLTLTNKAIKAKTSCFFFRQTIISYLA